MTTKLSSKYTYAVVGASNDPEKYGHKVLKYLIGKGQRAIPVNPKEKKILGLDVSADLSGIKEEIDEVVFVVPPKVTEKLLLEVKDLGIKKVWLQPGSESIKAIEYCDKHAIECVHDACVMMN